MTSEKNKLEIEKPDWTIEELYKKAWQIVKNNKILWVFGAAVGAGSSFNYNNSFGKSDAEWLKRLFEGDPEKSSEFAQVLGAVASKSGDTISQLFASVPVYFWFLLGLEFLFVILFSILISLIYQSWATGALLDNIERCIKGGKAAIREASEKAFKVLKPLLWLNIIPGLLLTLAGIAGFVIIISAIIFTQSVLKVLSVILLIAFIILLIYAWIMLTASLIWATRRVITENKPAKESLSSGYRIAKKKFWSMLLLGLVNNILVALVFGIPIVVIIGLIIGAVFAGKSFSIALFIIAGLLLFAFIIAGTIVSGILSAFKATVWSLAYNNIKEKYETR